MDKYVFEWIPDKTSVYLPENFKKQFDNYYEIEIPLILIDDNDNKESIIYNLEKNLIPIKFLINWQNDFQPKKNEKIALISLGSSTYKITILNKNSKFYEGLYLGKIKDSFNKFISNRNFVVPIEDLITHMFICGATGSGKTFLGKAVVEEMAIKKIPSIIIDLKGDLSSLGIIYEKYNYENLKEWLMPSITKDEDECKNKISEVNSYQDVYELTNKLKDYVNKFSIAVFTPKSEKGIPLSISSPLAAPKDINEMFLHNKSEVLEMIGSYTDSFIRSLFSERRIGRLDKYKTFLQEIVKYCWEKNIPLQGKKGLEIIQRMIFDSPIKQIGGMPLERFLNDKMRDELANRLAMCLTGVEQLWFEGVPLDINRILSRPNSDKEKTPISIINISELTLEEQMYVVSHLAYALYNWARPKGDAGGRPRILFFIDEIGAGGGKQAFYPSYPYNPPSKPPLNILLRKGRAFGISCLFATQNPGDIDYKGLSNCGIWAVGRLQTERDRKKIMEGISSADVYISNVKQKLENIEFNDFLIKTKSGRVIFIRQRWLVSYHKTLTEDELRKINKTYITEFFRN